VGYPLRKSGISSEEMERRREALREADASNRIEGIYRDPATDEIFEAFIRGDIELDELGAQLDALPDPE
jgi:Antitoxin VbhA